MHGEAVVGEEVASGQCGGKTRLRGLLLERERRGPSLPFYPARPFRKLAVTKKNRVLNAGTQIKMAAGLRTLKSGDGGGG